MLADTDDGDLAWMHVIARTTALITPAGTQAGTPGTG